MEGMLTWPFSVATPSLLLLQLQVAEAALCVLHALLIRIRVRADTKRMLCHAVVTSDLHQPLLSLMHIHPKSMGSSKVSLLLCLLQLCKDVMQYLVRSLPSRQARLHTHSPQAVECLAALAETNAAGVRVLARDGCVAALLAVLSQADLASKSVRSAAVLLQFIAQHQSSVR